MALGYIGTTDDGAAVVTLDGRTIGALVELLRAREQLCRSVSASSRPSVRAISAAEADRCHELADELVSVRDTAESEHARAATKRKARA